MSRIVRPLLVILAVAGDGIDPLCRAVAAACRGLIWGILTRGRWPGAFAAVAVALPLGCAPAPQEEFSAAKTLNPDEQRMVLVVGLDVSGSFRSFLFNGEGRAFKYTRNSLAKYFQANAGENARVVLVQLGEPGKAAIIFEGSPKTFRREFPDAETFKKFVLGRSGGGGSRLFLSMAESLEYVMDQYSEPGTRHLAMFMTDMIDTEGDPNGRLVKALTKYHQRGGGVGLYWIDDAAVEEVKRIWAAAQVKGFQIRRFVSDPPIPDFQ